MPVIRISQNLYDLLRKEQTRLSKERARHVTMTETIAYLIGKEIERITLRYEKTKAEVEKEIRRLEQERERLKAERLESQRSKPLERCKHGAYALACHFCLQEELDRRDRERRRYP